MQTIGFATIAESPRDDVIPAMRPYLPAGVRVAERGCLDGLSRVEIEALGPDEGQVGIVARLKAGGSTLLSHGKILPLMQRCMDELIRDESADLVVILCGADWSAIQAERLVVNPGRLFPGLIGGLAHGRRLGIIKPSAGQVDSERARYRAQGIDAVVTSANPYAAAERLALAHLAGRELREAGCDLVWMTCIGMDTAMRDVVAEVTDKPVVLAQAILARVVAELVPSRQPALVS
jgi:protein AroM